MRRALAPCLFVVSALLSAGCDCSPSTGVPPGSLGAPCASETECNAGLTCRDGRCEADADAGPIPREDAGGMDAGPVCAVAMRCGADCCEGSEECVGGACLPACASAVRCGPASTCCGDGELCIGDACVAPGAACEEAIDCPLDAHCDPGLMRCLPRTVERCEYFPEPGVFEPEQQWAWTTSTVRPENVHVMMAPVVGDVTGDGIPEVVFHTYNPTVSYGGDGVMRIVRGDTGEEVRSVIDPVVCPEAGIALGDLDGDGTPEIVTALVPCGNGEIVAFAPDGSVRWRSTNADGTPFTLATIFGAPAIADLEGDGMAEVIVGGAVLGANGVVRWTMGTRAGSNCCSDSGTAPLSAAYDMDGLPGLEVVGGNVVYRADGSVLWQSATLVDGYVAIADFYDDEIPDIAVVHQGAPGDDVGHVSVRRGTDGMVLFGPVALPGGGRGGPPTIADFDGDGLPEIGVAGANAYVVFDPDGATPVLWMSPTQDDSSHVTGSSVFDFDGDGSAEVVYNDECYMRVYAGLDGAVLAEVPQNSHTLVEYPLIVDVDADGNAEIVFAANSQVNRCAGIPDWTGLHAGIRVFRDATDNWVGTRTVWNQHTYHVTNVRQDLSIPAPQQPNWQRFNTFRQNSQSFDAPNLLPGSVDSDASACPSTLVLRAVIRNEGAVTVGPGLAVTFYAGSPTTPGRVLGTATTTAAIPPGSSATVSITFTPMAGEIGRDLPFFARADDVGDGTGAHNECIEDDNVLAGMFTCTSIE